MGRIEICSFRKPVAHRNLKLNRNWLAWGRSYRDQQDRLNDLGPLAENFHVDSGMSAGVRSQWLGEFEEASCALMTNARCLTEGVDVPDIDCVVFAAPKQSVIDIVQAAGRAMRRVEGKKYGYIVIPLVVPDNMPFKEFAETTAFRTVVKIINSLSTRDERIVEELRAIVLRARLQR